MTVKLTVHPNQFQSELKDLYGLFFEDINHAADGGIYAEMIQNRSFEFDPIDHPTYHALYGWETKDGLPLEEERLSLRVLSDNPIHPNNQHYLKINCHNQLIIRNKGFNNGLFIESEAVYEASFFAKADFNHQAVMIELQDEAGIVYDSAAVEINQLKWQRYKVELRSDKKLRNGRLALRFKENTNLSIDMISLFPADTFKNRVNGCRNDIAQKLADMKPKFMRFPGGCLVHDGSLNSQDRDSMYRWKNTLGPVETRPPRRNSWGYHQSLGLGYFEYFQLCEDLGAKPIPVLPAGFDPHHQRAVPFSELGEWIQDALDLIEFANGAADSEWGSVRAEMGHPDPFHLEYLAIGNEEVGQAFFDRYNQFHAAIKSVYPEMQLINSAGPFAEGSEYERGWANARQNQSDLVDEHYYQSPAWFFSNHYRYDRYSSDDPQVFLGEYASKENKWWNALAEASYMIGLERNADKVALACYAPMLANCDHVNWQPNLIWFNQEAVYGSVNYDVQKLFMTKQGSHNVAYHIDQLPEDHLIDDNPITGQIQLKADGAEIHYRDMIIHNKSTGEKTSVSSSQLSANDLIAIGNTDANHYSISFTFEKTAGRDDKGFNLIFGRRADDHYYNWALGGWQNQDCLLSAVHDGSDSVLTQSIWRVEPHQEYRCHIEINHRTITTHINDELFNHIEDAPYVMKSLYTNVVYDQETKKYYVKLVNAKADDLDIQVNCQDHNMAIKHSLSAAVTAKNSLDQPNQVQYSCEKYDLTTDTITIAAYSVVFLVLKTTDSI